MSLVFTYLLVLKRLTILVTNAACTPTTSLINVTYAVGNIACKVCTQSTDSRCSNSAIASVFAQYPGIKAVYCNDEFMVIHSDNTPNHADTLAYIPRPPGEGGSATYANQCVTRSRVGQFMSFKIPLKPASLLPNASSTNNAAIMATNGVTALSTVSLPESGPVAYTLVPISTN